MIFFKIHIKHLFNFFDKKKSNVSKETDYLLLGRNGKILLQSIKELEEGKDF